MLLFIIILAFIAIAAGLAWYFLAHDRGEKEPVGALWVALGFGFAGGIVAAVIESLLLPDKVTNPGTPLLTLLLAMLAVGVIEEACKFVPLSLFLYPKRYFNEHSDGIIYFAIAGLGFGLPENILYSLQFGTKAGISRIILTPFFHAATTGMVGFYLAKGKLAGKGRRLGWLALAAAMVLHGLYDFGLESNVPVLTLMAVMITIGMSVALFFFFARSVELDQASGLSVVGNNRFCRSCGHPNPERHLYCTRCGKRA